MDKKTFDDTEIEKYKFHQYKSPISMENIDVNKIVVSNKICMSFLIKDEKLLEKYNEIWKKSQQHYQKRI